MKKTKEKVLIRYFTLQFGIYSEPERFYNLAYPSEMHINTLRPRQNGRHFEDDILKCIFLNENI